MPNINKLNENGLNDKEQLFCDEYLTNGNNMRMAYKKAYKTENDKSCDTLGSKMLKKLEVVKYLDKKQKEMSETYGITRGTLLKELEEAKELAMLPDDRGKREMAVIVKIIEVKAKMLGLNEPEKIQHSGDKNNPIQANLELSQSLQNVVKDILKGN